MALDLASKRHGLVLLSQYAFSLDASPPLYQATGLCALEGIHFAVLEVDDVRAHLLALMSFTSEWPVGSFSIRTSALGSLAVVS